MEHVRERNAPYCFPEEISGIMMGILRCSATLKVQDGDSVTRVEEQVRGRGPERDVANCIARSGLYSFGVLTTLKSAFEWLPGFSGDSVLSFIFVRQVRRERDFYHSSSPAAELLRFPKMKAACTV